VNRPTALSDEDKAWLGALVVNVVRNEVMPAALDELVLRAQRNLTPLILEEVCAIAREEARSVARPFVNDCLSKLIGKRFLLALQEVPDE
jgi:hypothetical protein